MTKTPQYAYSVELKTDYSGLIRDTLLTRFTAHMEQRADKTSWCDQNINNYILDGISEPGYIVTHSDTISFIRAEDAILFRLRFG